MFAADLGGGIRQVDSLLRGTVCCDQEASSLTPSTLRDRRAGVPSGGS